MDRRFNIRVYGACFNEKQELLVADERIKGRYITKLPGGGLEFGEGTIDCLKREFVEETGQEIEVVEHLYTTDFFVPSAFNPESQVISIYYIVRFLKAPAFPVSTKRFDFPERKDDIPMDIGIAFRWLPLNDVHPDEFTFPIDKKVAELIIKLSL